MIEVRPASAEDIEQIAAGAKEAWVREHAARAAGMVKGTALVGTVHGVPAFAGGFVDQGNGVALSWTLIGDVPRSAFTGVVRAVRAVLDAAPFHWIEAHCVETFPAAFKWVRLLGFEQVDGARCFTPDGREFRRFAYKRLA